MAAIFKSDRGLAKIRYERQSDLRAAVGQMYYDVRLRRYTWTKQWQNRSVMSKRFVEISDGLPRKNNCYYATSVSLWEA
jgi:hypothetical protein